MDDNDIAIEKGLNSQIGRRRAYQTLINQQRENNNGECEITFFAMLTHYRLSDTEKRKSTVRQLLPNELLKIDNQTGLMFEPTDSSFQFAKCFRVGNIIFTYMSKSTIVHLSPYIPIDTSDEKSCYSTLLLYLPWPANANESNDTLFPESTNAVNHFNHLQSQSLFPLYLSSMLTRIHHSEQMLANMGQPVPGHFNDQEQDTVSDTSSECDSHFDDTSVQNENAQIPPEDFLMDTINNSIRNDSDFSSNQNAIDMPNLHQNQLLTGITSELHTYLKSFISNSLKLCIEKRGNANQIDSASDLTSLRRGYKINVANYSLRRTALEIEVLSLKTAQKHAYDIITQYVTSNNKQLLMFVSGEGGTGKSKLIEIVMEFTRLHFGKQRGYHGACIAIAPTGSSASNIKGTTWQATLGKKRTDKNKGVITMSSLCAKQVGSKLDGCRLVIIDEVGMISSQQLQEISERIKIAKLAVTSDTTQQQIIKGTMHK